MIGWNFIDASYWWVFPVIMMVLCFLMMRGRKSSRICGFGFEHENKNRKNSIDSPMDILNKRYALGEIENKEYEEKKRVLKQQE
jgi:uncharacterized membrane protein